MQPPFSSAYCDRPHRAVRPVPLVNQPGQPGHPGPIGSCRKTGPMHLGPFSKSVEVRAEFPVVLWLQLIAQPCQLPLQIEVYRGGQRSGITSRSRRTSTRNPGYGLARERGSSHRLRQSPKVNLASSKDDRS